MDETNLNDQPIEEIEEVVDQPVEEPEEVDEQVEEEVPQEAEGDEPEEVVEQPSRRESLRIQKLIERMKTNQPANQPTPQGLNYGDALDADPKVVAQLEADRRAYGEQAYTQGLAQAQSVQFHTRLEIDAPKVTAKYPQFNPEDKANFNPVLADAINAWYLSSTGYSNETGIASNPNIRYSEFVDGIMELGNEIAGQKVQATAKNVARQAATTGLRPDGSSSKRMNLNQPVENMSDEELEAYGKHLGLATQKRR